MGMKRVATILYVVGLVLALLAGALADLFIQEVIVAFYVVVVLFGLVVGYLNAAKEETEDILYTTAVLALVALATGELARVAPDMFGDFVVGAGRGLIAYAFAVALVVGSKRVLDLGEGF
jgi:hypothetical protein